MPCGQWPDGTGGLKRGRTQPHHGRNGGRTVLGAVAGTDPLLAAIAKISGGCRGGIVGFDRGEIRSVAMTTVFGVHGLGCSMMIPMLRVSFSRRNRGYGLAGGRKMMVHMRDRRHRPVEDERCAENRAGDDGPYFHRVSVSAFMLKIS